MVICDSTFWFQAFLRNLEIILLHCSFTFFKAPIPFTFWHISVSPLVLWFDKTKQPIRVLLGFSWQLERYCIMQFVFPSWLIISVTSTSKAESQSLHSGFSPTRVLFHCQGRCEVVWRMYDSPMPRPTHVAHGYDFRSYTVSAVTLCIVTMSWLVFDEPAGLFNLVSKIRVNAFWTSLINCDQTLLLPSMFVWHGLTFLGWCTSGYGVGICVGSLALP